ncbi:hypothetical protein HQ305_11720 [Rhodococcus sp. BP-149]|uniref:hypothetical protein n=1 Tax=unclassified Rhodococcus (in: high G+C Gram-positive bacteria) TaxID=192944 RepID=UPI001C9B2165|nr:MULTISPECIES: hypothetical protein [unclassified Rhodococcus (in: high G+C Gram-positive bacteria)]MBY6685448.1 hypothetical protein [Rhodococcus sp. BP-288]MBY6694987.1 hypothetical protein [Rhodococcus sp. BP-188]MBY6696850.1 hypothetical protein [Rhodococcus sp. BP-285]MBY6703506.1 hypothetical protein [Rhodococcus sp. BP-283]MBY6710540.1 hypothetical protein [Rhodococcus sp. BP-160]
MVYRADHPPVPDHDELRARIPGWGVDLDPADRPSVPRERFDPGATGAHWDFPERQPELRPRERSIEHGTLPPVFGTTAPLRGVSGAVRRFAYRYSEGRAAHWLLLLAGDRVDAVESHLHSLTTVHPDNPITQTGIRTEITHHGVRSRRGTTRVDMHHAWIDPIIVGGPWVLAGVAATTIVRSLRRR